MRMKPQLVSALWPLGSKRSHIKMVRASALLKFCDLLYASQEIVKHTFLQCVDLCGPVPLKGYL